jgi:hypothetical protein
VSLIRADCQPGRHQGGHRYGAAQGGYELGRE